MSKRSRLSRDQKRKQKLARRGPRERPWYPSPPKDKYRRPEFVDLTLQTEIGIYEAFVVSGRSLTDSEVERDLKQLIERLRSSPAAKLIYSANEGSAEQQEESGQGYAAMLVLLRWRQLLEQGDLPARDDLIGVLQSILGSLATWGSRSASARAYLAFLEGFMDRAGVSVQVTAGGEPSEGEPVDELYEIGRIWLEGSDEARGQFAELARDMLARGDSDQVLEATRKLLATVTPTSPEFSVLSELSIRAERAPSARRNSGFANGLKRFVARLGDW